MAILQRQNSQRLLTLELSLKCQKLIGLGQTSNLIRQTYIYFEIGAWMVQRLLQYIRIKLIGSTLAWLRLAKSDNATVVRRFIKRRSKYALNSIHKSWNYKIIDSNVMDWANVRKIHTPPSAKRYFPRWRVRAEDNSATGNGQL